MKKSVTRKSFQDYEIYKCMDFKEKGILACALTAVLQTQEGCEKVDFENKMV